MKLADVKKTVEQLAKQSLDDLSVRRIDVLSDVDWEGDAIYRIVVILDRHNQLTGKRSAEFSSKVRTFMADYPAYPIVSFRSSNDDKGLRAEAA
jgi:hypothetical protein